MGGEVSMLGTVEYFVDQTLNGVTLGAIYGLIAIGYTLVYGIIGMINFAHGEIFMIGAFLSIITFLVLGIVGITWVPLALLIMLIVTMVLTPIYGWTLERVAYRPLRRSPRLAALITAIGMSIFLQNYVQILQSARNKPMEPLISGGVTLMQKGNYVVSLSYLQMLFYMLRRYWPPTSNSALVIWPSEQMRTASISTSKTLSPLAAACLRRSSMAGASLAWRLWKALRRFSCDFFSFSVERASSSVVSPTSSWASGLTKVLTPTMG